jgi:hypothetical protein
VTVIETRCTSSTLWRRLRPSPGGSTATDRLADVPWNEIRGFRNHAVHAYFSIDWEIVREIAVVNLPELRDRAMQVLRLDFPDLAAALEGGSHSPQV